MERYLEATQQILDRTIVTPDLVKTYTAAQMLPAPAAATPGAREVTATQELSVLTPVYLDGDYTVSVAVPSADIKGKLALKVDGATGVPLTVAVRQGRGGGGGGGGGRGRGGGGGPSYNVQVRLARGLRMLSVVSDGAPVPVNTFTIQQKAVEPSPEKLALHYRLLGTEPGNEPLQPRKAAEQVLRTFLRKAYRRPVEAAEVTPFLTLYDRAAERGDPYEERMKLALKAILVSPDFIFKMEHRNDKPGIYPAGAI